MMFYNNFGISMGPALLGFMFVILVWSAIWKGLALWKAARSKHTAWFIIILVLNTLGLVEILYIFVFSKCCQKIEIIPTKKAVKQTSTKLNNLKSKKKSRR